MEVAGTTAVVTGASSGIGAATASRLAEAGSRVVLVARTVEALERVAQHVRATGGIADVIPADLSDPDAVDRVAAEVVERAGTPDIVVNNAGAGRWLHVLETDPDELLSMTAVPYFAAFNLTRGLLAPMLAARRGTIVTLTSPAAYAPWPGATAYSVSRWAMRGFHEALRADLHGTGVRTLLVVPSTVESGYWEHNPGARERTPSIGRLYRTLTPDEVASAIVHGLRRDRHEVYLPALLRATVVLQRWFPGVVRSLVIRTSPPAARHLG